LKISLKLYIKSQFSIDKNFHSKIYFDDNSNKGGI